MAMPNLAPDGLVSARTAGLRYVNDGEPGIVRVRRGKGFVYFDPNGKRVTQRETLERIRRIVIPPAWTHVWICTSPKGHIQATGRDAKGRKQYKYHADWRAVRDETKFERMVGFAEALPALRAKVDAELAAPGLPREKVLATVVRLLDLTHIRVGNDEYARKNGSYGLTTLRENHVDVSGPRIRFHFRGKSGKKHFIEVEDQKLAKIVRRCQEIPGHELFHYLEPEGRPRVVESTDVNAYLRELTGRDFTAKDFRTWAGTVLAGEALACSEPVTSSRQAKQRIVGAIRSVAERLGNTPAVCKKSYVHPAILDPSLYQVARSPRARAKRIRGLTANEIDVLAILRRHAGPLNGARRRRGAR